MTYTITFSDGGGGEDTYERESYDVDELCQELAEWIRDGEWGEDGAAVDAHLTVEDEDGDEIEREYVTVEIEPDHDAMIRAAGGDTDCDHDWTSEGEGGCSENPGVWSHGGTAMTFSTHCTRCGLHRVETHTGSQRNPGEHDTVEYSQPANWCAECQSEDCTCQELPPMTRYRMDDGSVVDTGLAKQSWDGPRVPSWNQQTLHRSRKGRYYVETAQYDGLRSFLEWVSREEAARWLLANDHELPADLADLESEVME